MVSLHCCSLALPLLIACSSFTFFLETTKLLANKERRTDEPKPSGTGRGVYRNTHVCAGEGPTHGLFPCIHQRYILSNHALIIFLYKVNKEWNTCTNSSALWRELVYRLHVMQNNNEGEPLKIEYQVDRPEMNNIEQLDNGLVEGQQSYPEPQYSKMNEWKKYYAWKASFEHFTWQTGPATDCYSLTISEDGKTCSLGPGG